MRVFSTAHAGFRARAVSVAAPAMDEERDAAAGSSESGMPTQVFTMSGKSLMVQPAVDDTGFTLRSRVADEIGIAPDCVRLLHGCSVVSDETVLADLGSEHVQAIVFISIEEKLRRFWQHERMADRKQETHAVGYTGVVDFFNTVEIESSMDLFAVVSSIKKTALSDTNKLESKHLSMTCAKAAATLSLRGLEFDVRGPKPATPGRVLLNSLQKEFEGMETPKRDSVVFVPFIQFVLNLFRRQQLAWRVIVSICGDLIEPPFKLELLRVLVRRLRQARNSGHAQIHINKIMNILLEDNDDDSDEHDDEYHDDQYDEEFERQQYRMMGLDMYGQG